jgi:hypothetical protein
MQNVTANVAAVPQLAAEQAEVEVRNACGIDGAAAAANGLLAERGFSASVRDAQDYSLGTVLSVNFLVGMPGIGKVLTDRTVCHLMKDYAH